MAWTMDDKLETRRELGVQQLLGIARTLDTRGVTGVLRARQAVGMAYTVEHARSTLGIDYDGGDWATFMGTVNDGL